MSWAYNKKQEGTEISILLHERDTDQSETDIDSLIRLHYFSLCAHFAKQGNFDIESYLGDNDIIGIKNFSHFYKGMQDKFGYNGVFKLDQYDYRLSVTMF